MRSFDTLDCSIASDRRNDEMTKCSAAADDAMTTTDSLTSVSLLDLLDHMRSVLLLRSAMISALASRASSFVVSHSSTATKHTIRSMTSTSHRFGDDEKYLFDLNGYIIVRGVLTPEEVKAANDAIDNHESDFVQRNAKELRNAKENTPLYGTGPGRKDMGRVMEWGEESKVFKSILAHPKLVPYFHGLLGKGYRMDHLPFIIAQDEGGEGFQLHGGTIDCTSGEYNPYLAYTCHQGKVMNALLGVNVMLTDHNAGDGGFCVVNGSHKSNFKMPKGMVDGEKYQDFIQQPVTKAGDVVLFSEGTVHGAMAWTPTDRQRRTCLYRFSPATNVYGRSYFGHEGGGWPTAIYDDLDEAQKSVLEPPYANRLDRPNIKDDGSVEITTRNERKKAHDAAVFGTKYF